MGSSGLRLFKKALQFPTKENITYIFPTKFGFAFAVTTLILFFFAAGYANNLIYIFVFLLAAIALVGTLATNKNIEGLHFVSSTEPRVFANTPVYFEFTVRSKNGGGSFEVSTMIKNSVKEQNKAIADVPPGHQTSLRAKTSYPLRGIHPGPVMQVESDFPFGLLKSWRYFKPWQQVVVYPRLVGTKQFPQDIEEADRSGGFGVFREHKPYSSSEPQNRIDWKASARRSEILVKYFEEQTHPNLNFNWDQTKNIEDFEGRVSQLALWVDQARNLNRNFTLELGTKKFESAQIDTNWQQALRALANLSEADVMP